MKDKTHAMNRGHGGADKGYETIPDSEVPTRKKYKDRQMRCAGLLDDTALSEYENRDGDEGAEDLGGFLPRNNYSERY